MDFVVYIIFSEKLNKFYTGYSSDFKSRLAYHNDPLKNRIWTKKGIPWVEFLAIQCTHEIQAIRLERHIKKMKSKTYIQNLVKYPSLIGKLLKTFEV